MLITPRTESHEMVTISYRFQQRTEPVWRQCVKAHDHRRWQHGLYCLTRRPHERVKDSWHA